MIEMDQVEKNRHINCLQLKRDRCGDKLTVFAEKVDRKHNQISSLIGKTPTKAIGKRLARHFEQSFDLSSGWLDIDHRESNKAHSKKGNSPIQWVDAEHQDGKFELIIDGISMVRPSSEHGMSFRPGDIVMFDPNFNDIVGGKYYLYKLESQDKPILGQHYQSTDGFKIHFLSDAYTDVDVTDSKQGGVIAELIQFRSTNFDI